MGERALTTQAPARRREPVTVFVASPFPDEQVERITAVDRERVRLIYRPDLLYPRRHPADHDGDPAWVRAPDAQAEWDHLQAQAEVSLDIDGRAPETMLERAPNLRWLHAVQSGVTGVLRVVRGLRDSDVVLTNSAGIHAVPLAEWAIFAMLWFTKSGARILAQQQARDWVEFTPGELKGRTLLIVGLGRIGQEVARRARALGVRVVAVKRDPSGSAMEWNVDELAPPSGLLAALADADFVCLAVPLVPDTTGLIGHRELAVMAPHAVLINIARGPVVDEDALLEALRAGRIGGAALDVFREEPLPPAHPFWERPDVLLSPHCVGGSPFEHERIVDIFTDNLARYFRGQPMRNLVDKQRGY